MKKILTDNYQTISPEFKNYLLNYQNIPTTIDFSNEPYQRCWTKDISAYATHYNNIDVLLAPLVESDFNKYKSQLKAIESGFFNKVIIAQNFGPYTIDLINAINRGGEINPDGNALLVDSIKNHKQWAKYIEKLVNNPELITLISNNLNKLITEKYSLENVTKKRVELYKKILKDEE